MMESKEKTRIFFSFDLKNSDMHGISWQTVKAGL